MNISKETIEQLNELFFIWFGDGNCNEVPANVATELNIGISKEDGNYIGKAIKATKKEITLEYVMNKISSDKIYSNFSNTFKSILPLEYKDSINVYPTTYGIGCFVAFGFRSSIDQMKHLITAILNQSGIEYSNEYSQAGWVLRYKISKSAANIEKINSYIKRISE